MNPIQTIKRTRRRSEDRIANVPIRVALTNEEILADLRYPANPAAIRKEPLA